jgi:hypothetical protein
MGSFTSPHVFVLVAGAGIEPVAYGPRDRKRIRQLYLATA